MPSMPDGPDRRERQNAQPRSALPAPGLFILFASSEASIADLHGDGVSLRSAAPSWKPPRPTSGPSPPGCPAVAGERGLVERGRGGCDSWRCQRRATSSLHTPPPRSGTVPTGAVDGVRTFGTAANEPLSTPSTTSVDVEPCVPATCWRAQSSAAPTQRAVEGPEGL